MGINLWMIFLKQELVLQDQNSKWGCKVICQWMVLELEDLKLLRAWERVWGIWTKIWYQTLSQITPWDSKPCHNNLTLEPLKLTQLLGSFLLQMGYLQIMQPILKGKSLKLGRFIINLLQQLQTFSSFKTSCPQIHSQEKSQELKYGKPILCKGSKVNSH